MAKQLCVQQLVLMLTGIEHWYYWLICHGRTPPPISKKIGTKTFARAHSKTRYPNKNSTLHSFAVSCRFNRCFLKLNINCDFRFCFCSYFINFCCIFAWVVKGFFLLGLKFINFLKIKFVKFETSNNFFDTFNHLPINSSKSTKFVLI